MGPTDGDRGRVDICTVGEVITTVAGPSPSSRWWSWNAAPRHLEKEGREPLALLADEER